MSLLALSLSMVLTDLGRQWLGSDENLLAQGHLGAAVLDSASDG